MDAKKRNIFIGIGAGVIVAIFVAIAFVGIFRGFNAQKYVNAVLKQNLKGNVEEAVRMANGPTEAQAKQQYEMTIESFVSNVVANGLELTEKEKKQCIDLTKEIFADMKFEVQEAKKISDDEFEVPVKYQVSDVMVKLHKLAQDEKAKVEEKVQKGEFRGSDEELEAQMQAEFSKNLPDMLKKAHETMEFGKEETMILKVKKNENGLYTLDGTQISQFIAKIMGLTVKED